MNKIEWNVLIWGLPVVVALYFFGDYMYTKGVEDSNAANFERIEEILNACQIDLP